MNIRDLTKEQLQEQRTDLKKKIAKAEADIRFLEVEKRTWEQTVNAIYDEIDRRVRARIECINEQTLAKAPQVDEETGEEVGDEG